ncbi:hypothetical protein SprV_0702344100 [Sparganum proliferum]
MTLAEIPEVASTSGSEAEAADSSATIPGCTYPPYADKLRGPHPSEGRTPRVQALSPARAGQYEARRSLDDAMSSKAYTPGL